MHQVDSVEELIEHRQNVVLLRQRFAFFFVDAALAGYFVWGRLIDEDALEGVRIYRAVVDAGVSKLVSDYSRTEHFDSASVQILASSLEQRLDRYRSIELRQAVIHPSNVAGAVVAGFFSAFPPGFSHASFASRKDALEWLERADAAPVLERLDDIVRARTSISEVQRRLRELLWRLPSSALTVDHAARQLRLKKRTLQLHLERAGTSFREELAAVRLERVKERLRHGDDKLLRIALDAGFTSAQHFSRWFRARTGLTPSDYRARART